MTKQLKSSKKSGRKKSHIQVIKCLSFIFIVAALVIKLSVNTQDGAEDVKNDTVDYFSIELLYEPIQLDSYIDYSNTPSGAISDKTDGRTPTDATADSEIENSTVKTESPPVLAKPVKPDNNKAQESTNTSVSENEQVLQDVTAAPSVSDQPAPTEKIETAPETTELPPEEAIDVIPNLPCH